MPFECQFRCSINGRDHFPRGLLLDYFMPELLEPWLHGFGADVDQRLRDAVNKVVRKSHFRMMACCGRVGVLQRRRRVRDVGYSLISELPAASATERIRVRDDVSKSVRPTGRSDRARDGQPD